MVGRVLPVVIALQRILLYCLLVRWTAKRSADLIDVTGAHGVAIVAVCSDQADGRRQQHTGRDRHAPSQHADSRQPPQIGQRRSPVLHNDFAVATSPAVFGRIYWKG